MVSFGLIDEWDPAPGRLVSWSASPDSVARAASAPVYPAPPSHQQESYLRLAHRNATADFRYSGLCVVTAQVARGGVYANRAAAEEVLMWINRFPAATSLSVIYPDTPVAHDSVDRYVHALRSVFLEVVNGAR